VLKGFLKLRLPAILIVLVGFPSITSAEILFHLKSMKQNSIACTADFEVTNKTDHNITTLITKIFILDEDKGIIDSMLFTGRLKKGKTSLDQLNTPSDCDGIKFVKMGGITMVSIDGEADWMIKSKIEDLLALRSSMKGIEVLE
jgi:hypothetical protein